MATKTPKKTRASTGTNYDPGIFRHVMTLEDFADVLGVNKKTIPLIMPLTDLCKSIDCPFNAIESNYGYCPVHCKNWYPKEGDRGASLLGPEYLRSRNKKFRGCNCSYPPCRDAGYFPSHNALYIPFAMRQEILSTGALFSEEKLNEYIENPNKNMSLYPWHFLRHHLIFQDGCWKLDYDENAPKKYNDYENASHDSPPPIGNVMNFIAAELTNFIRPQDRWMEENSESKMPMWMLEMLVIDDEYSLTKEPSPRKAKIEKQASSARTQKMKSEMQRARVKCLSDRISQMKLSSDHKLDTAVTRHKKAISMMRKDHEEAISTMQKEHENAMAATKENHKQATVALTKQCSDRLKEKDAELDAARATIDKQATTISRLEELIDELDRNGTT